MKTRKLILLWFLAILLSLLIGIFQRLTGPTHPVRGMENLGGKSIKYRLLRSYTAFENMPVSLIAEDSDVRAYLNYRRYHTKDQWTEIEMSREGNRLNAEIPGHPVAGKVEYSIRVHIKDQNFLINQGKSLVARFKGKVPSVFLILHIVFMFLGIIFSIRTGMEALRKEGHYYWLVNSTLVIIFIGGLIFGPIVQQYAFGDWWTGFPFGFDLTDNKVLLAFSFWVIAFFLKKKSKWWVLGAVILMTVIYLIPHSVLGSELDYETGKMKNKYSFHQISSRDGKLPRNRPV
ncbi:MAG: hypothetical protein KAT17_00015 [Candidatus Aminicenantes bacterium]|nr:hypothetical protein [Candidatus Aminicenantes bacterium]